MHYDIGFSKKKMCQYGTKMALYSVVFCIPIHYYDDLLLDPCHLGQSQKLTYLWPIHGDIFGIFQSMFLFLNEKWVNMIPI